MPKENETPGGVGDGYSCGMRFWQDRIGKLQVKVHDEPNLSKYDRTVATESLELASLKYKQLIRRRRLRLI